MSVAATAVQLQHQQPQPPPFHLRIHDPLTAAPPPPPPQPLYRASSCDRHPDQPVTGFCADCLRERLEGLDAATRRAEKAKSGSSGAAAVLKSVFFRHTGNNQNPSSSSSSSAASSFLPELRRCKSFSGSSLFPPQASSSFEPQRRSCDVRGRNTLYSLFHLDDKQEPPAAYAPYIGSLEADRRNLGAGLGFPPVAPPAPVLESRVEEEDEEEEEEEVEEDEEEFQEGRAQADSEDAEIFQEAFAEVSKIRPAVCLDRVHVGVVDEVFDSGSSKGRRSVEISQEEAKPMKEHIDVDGLPPAHPREPPLPKKAPNKDFKEIAGSFWLAASVFSKKLQKWRRKQKLKKQQQQEASSANASAKQASSGAGGAAAMRGGDNRHFLSSRWSRRYRDTQMEFAEDVCGRRSCDTDPRFSLDAGRMSFDDPRYSWDEPRASWDGYLIGGAGVGTGRSGPFPRLPPILSVIEDGPVAPAVQRFDGLIPVEEDQTAPGGTLQTKEYYSDNTQRRRRSLDRSSSMRRPGLAAAVSAVENNDPPRLSLSNGKVTPPAAVATNEFFHHVQRFEREFRDSNPTNTLTRDDCFESFDSTTAPFGSYTDPGPGPKNPKVDPGLPPKKPRRWGKAWNILGFIHWRNNKANGGGGDNGAVGRSMSESWRDVRRDGCGGTGSVLRSNPTVSGRHSFSGSSSAGFGSMRRNGLDLHSTSKRKDDFSLERNRSARFSPGRLDNGMLRFYLTPMRSGSGRRGGGAAGGRHMGSHPFTRNVLRLY